MKSLFSIVIICLLLVPMGVNAAAVEAEWIDTDKPNCKIWNEVPAKGETVSWSGECVKGYASGYGTAIWSLNDKEAQRYEGILKKGKCADIGTLTFANGNKYAGDFKNNKSTGKGTYTFANGDKYEGSFVDSDFISTAKGRYPLPNRINTKGTLFMTISAAKGLTTMPMARDTKGALLMAFPRQRDLHLQQLQRV